MTADPKYRAPEFSSAPELDPLHLSPEQQARLDATREHAEASHLAGMETVLADAEATARRLASAAAMRTESDDLWGEFCVNCQQRWALPAHKATCAHKPICEDCYPNGCEACEREVEEALQRRERATHRILSAALEIRTSVDDLSETDLKSLGWVTRKDVLHQVDLTFEALRRVRDVLRSQESK